MKGKHTIRWIILAVVIIAIAAAVGFVLMGKFKRANTSTDQAITTEPIEKRTLSNTISITGTIAANDSQTIYSNNQGCEVTAINVKIGDYVNAGDVIATLDSSDYEDDIAAEEKKRTVAIQKSQLNAGEATRSLVEAQVDASNDIARAQEDIDEACEDYTSVVDKKNSAYNDYLLACDDTNTAREDRDTKKEKYSNLKKALKEDVENGTISKNSVEYEERNAEVETAKAAYNNAESAVSSAEKNEESLEAAYEAYGDKIASSVRSYESAVEKKEDATTSGTRSIEKSQDSVTSASLDSSTVTDEYDKKIEEYQKLVEKCTVKASISGVVTSIPMEVGDEIASDNNEICVIQDDSSYIVEADVDQYEISDIYEGMQAVIKTDATGDIEMKGIVTFVSPTPESSNSGSSTGGSSATGGTSSSSTTTYPIKIAIQEKQDDLRIGMTAETSLVTEQVKDVLAVPYDCVSTDQDGNSVIYVLDQKVTMPVSDNSTLSGNKPSSGDKPSSGNQHPSNNDQQLKQKAVIVEKGLETDYYTEIKSDQISEGMMVVVPNSISSETGQSNTQEGSLGGGMNSGGPLGGMGGGAPGGGRGGF